MELSVDRTHIRVIDRRKNFFKLSVGEFISPTKLESIFLSELSRLVSQILIVGDSSRSYIIAIVVTQEESSRKVLAGFAAVAEKHKLKQIEIPRGVVLLSNAWTFENGLLTANLKLNRIKIRQTFSAEISSLFEKLDAESASSPSLSVLPPRDSFLLEPGRTPSSSFLSSVKELLRTEEIDIDRSLAENGADSITCVRLRLRLGSSASSVSAAQLLHLPIRALLQLVSSTENAQKHKEESQQRVRLLMESDLTIDPLENLSVIDIPSPSTKHVLLTGSSGFVGAHLLSVLLREGTRVTCIVRNLPSSSSSSLTNDL